MFIGLQKKWWLGSHFDITYSLVYVKWNKINNLYSALLLGGPSSEAQSTLIKFQRRVEENKHGRNRTCYNLHSSVYNLI